MHPENALLDFRREAAPLVYLAELIETDMDASESERALALAVQQVHERAEQALMEAGESERSREAARGREQVERDQSED